MPDKENLKDSLFKEITTDQEQGSAAVDVVFRILEDAEKRIDALDHKTEKGGEGDGERKAD